MNYHQNHKELLIDIGIILASMIILKLIFLEITFNFAGPISLFITLSVATWRLKVRGESWRNLGLRRPESLLKMLGVIAFIFIFVIPSSVIVNLYVTQLFPSQTQVIDRFEGISGNTPYFIFWLLVAYVTSFTEELLNRAFMVTWLERLFSKFPLPVFIAVVLQAVLFGSMHYLMQGLAGAFSTATIGLVFGIAYVLFKRNLWALIIAHCLLNTISITNKYLA